MQMSDFEGFKREMAQLCETYNRPLTDEFVQSYWRALSDLKLTEVTGAIQSLLKRGADKFPKPWELRDKPLPKETELPRDAVESNLRLWREKHARDPRRTKIEHEWCRLQRMLATEPPDSPQYSEALANSLTIQKQHGNPRFW